MLGQLKNCSSIAGNKSFIKINSRLTEKRIIFETVFLLKNQGTCPIKSILLYRQIQDSFKGHYLFFRVRSSSLENKIKELKREKLEAENF